MAEVSASDLVVVPDPDDDGSYSVRTPDGTELISVGWQPSNLRFVDNGGDYTLLVDTPDGYTSEEGPISKAWLANSGIKISMRQRRKAKVKTAYNAGDSIEFIGNTFTRDEQGWWWGPLGSTVDPLGDRDIQETVSFGGILRTAKRKTAGLNYRITGPGLDFPAGGTSDDEVYESLKDAGLGFSEAEALADVCMYLKSIGVHERDGYTIEITEAEDLGI